jgi:phosphoribosylformimino-5-aminoimidazole carboxamide ribotide isomerase
VYLLPVIEVKGRESVHILQDASQGEARPLLDPLEVLNRFIGQGAQGAHVVDVDHALDPHRNNDETLVRMLDHIVIPVVAGGGVRSMKRIQELLDTGARRVLVGSMGVLHPDWLKEAALIFEDRLVACVDVRDGAVLVKGRTERATATLDALVSHADGLGLHSLHVTFLGKNGGGVPLMEGLAKRLKTPLTYQGPVAGPEDLSRLERAGIKGVVLGPEIYDGRLSFTPLAKAYRVR